MTRSQAEPQKREREPKTPSPKQPRESVLSKEEIDRRVKHAVDIIDPERSPETVFQDIELTGVEWSNRREVCESEVRHRLSMWGFDGVGYDQLQILVADDLKRAAGSLASSLDAAKKAGEKLRDGASGTVSGPLAEFAGMFGPGDIEWQPFEAMVDKLYARAVLVRDTKYPHGTPSAAKQRWAAKQAVDLLRLFHPDWKLKAAPKGPVVSLAACLYGSAPQTLIKYCQKAIKASKPG